MIRSLAFYSLLTVLVFVVLTALFPNLTDNYLPHMTTSLAGWHDRASPYTAPFSPKHPALRLVVLRNAPVEPEGITLVLFDSPAKIAVDAAGKVLAIQDSDFAGLLALAEQTKDLPPTDRFRNTWVIDQPFTSQPIDRILLPTIATGSDANDYFQTSVQGFDGMKTRLREPVGEVQELPVVLQELMGFLLEARKGSDGERDNKMISQVKSILGDVF